MISCAHGVMSSVSLSRQRSRSTPHRKAPSIWLEHDADAGGAFLEGPKLRLVAGRPGAGVVGLCEPSRPRVDRNFRQPAVLALRFPGDPDREAGESGERDHGAHIESQCDISRCGCLSRRSPVAA
jgi:hypothetical protein